MSASTAASTPAWYRRVMTLVPSLKPRSPPNYAQRACFATDGARLLLSRDNGSVEIYDVASRALLFQRELFRAGYFTADALALDGEDAAIFGSDGVLHLWHLPTDTLRSVPLQRSWGGAHVAMAGNDCALALSRQQDARDDARGWMLLHVRDGGVMSSVPLAGEVTQLEVVDGALYLAVAGGLERRAWTAAAGVMLHDAADGDVLAFHVQSGRALVRRGIDDYAVASLRGGRAVPLVRWPGSTDPVAFRERELLVRADHEYARFSTETGEALPPLEHGGGRSRVDVLAVHGETHRALVRRDYDEDILISLDDAGPPLTIARKRPSATTTRMGPDGAPLVVTVAMTAAVGHGGQRVDLHRVPAGARLVAVERGLQLGIGSVTSDGARVVAVGLDGRAHVWDAPTGKRSSTTLWFACEADTDLVPAVETADGRWALERNRLLRLFDLDGKEPVQRFPLLAAIPLPVDDDDAADELSDAEHARREAQDDRFVAAREEWYPPFALAPDGEHLLLVGDERVFELVRESAGGGSKRTVAKVKERHVAIHGHRGTVVIAREDAVELRQLWAPTKQRVVRWPVDGQRDVLGIGEAARFVALTKDGALEVRDARTGHEHWRASLAPPPQAFPAKWHFVSLSEDGDVLWLANGGRLIALVRGELSVEYLALADGEHLARGRDGWDASPGAFDAGFITVGGRVLGSPGEAARVLGDPHPLASWSAPLRR